MTSKNRQGFIFIHVLQCERVSARATVSVYVCAHSMFQTGLHFCWQRCCNVHNSLGKCNEVKCHNIVHRSASLQFCRPTSLYRCHVCLCLCVFTGSIALCFVLDETTSLDIDGRSQRKLPQSHHALYSNMKCKIHLEHVQDYGWIRISLFLLQTQTHAHKDKCNVCYNVLGKFNGKL